MTHAPLEKFYKKSLNERIQNLIDTSRIDAETVEQFKTSLLLSDDTANHMIENQIGTYQLPLGLGLNFVINDQIYDVPMATEEPSVIAAASFGAKTIKASGGFTTYQDQRLMVGQVALRNVSDPHDKKERVYEAHERLIELAHQAHPSIVRRGGGVKAIDVRLIDENQVQGTPDFFIVHLLVDTSEAMGANMVNTMVEAIKDELELITGGDCLMGILSNYATENTVTSTCIIPPTLLSRAEIPGEEVRDRIVEANQFAIADPYRAVTHNKGIMNGIDAVVLATGNDTRAIAAGIHAFASRSGQYRALTNWYVDDQGNLVGTITVPMAIGTVGGSISIHPGAQFAQSMLNKPTASELAGIIASVGLAQNFSALRALVTEGIQKGHMSLQAKSLAMVAGAKGKEIEAITKQLKQEPLMNLAVAEKLLKAYRDQ